MSLLQLLRYVLIFVGRGGGNDRGRQPMSAPGARDTALRVLVSCGLPGPGGCGAERASSGGMA